jgi:hypothetical protein
MSAQLKRPDRPSFASWDWFDGTAEEYREGASTYIAYSVPVADRRFCGAFH